MKANIKEAHLMETSPAPALTKGLEIIELIAEEGELGFNVISEKRNISASTLYRILKILVSKSYLVKNAKGKYMLGSRIFTLAKTNCPWNAILKRASLILKEISEKYEVTAMLFGFSDESIIALDKAVNINSVVMQPVGSVSKQYLSRPWGYVYMANLSSDRQQKLIKLANKSENEKNEIPRDEDLKKYFDFVKNHGYSDDFGNIKPSIRKLAAPIYDGNKQVISALSVAFISAALSDKEVRELSIFLKGKAYELTTLITV